MFESAAIMTWPQNGPVTTRDGIYCGWTVLYDSEVWRFGISRFGWDRMVSCGMLETLFVSRAFRAEGQFLGR